MSADMKELVRSLDSAAKIMGLSLDIRGSMPYGEGLRDQARLIEEIAKRLVALEAKLERPL